MKPTTALSLSITLSAIVILAQEPPTPTNFRVVTVPAAAYIPGLAIVDSSCSPPILSGNLAPWDTLQLWTWTWATNDCNVLEGCNQAGTRRMLSFGVIVYNPNHGTNDYWYGSTNNIDYGYDPCHHHAHVTNFVEFRIINCAGITNAARKQAWCMMNAGQVLDYGWNTNPPSFMQCLPNPVIMPGWGDKYDEWTTCMWFDITGWADGDYLMIWELDPLKRYSSHYLTSHWVRLADSNSVIYPIPYSIACH